MRNCFIYAAYKSLFPQFLTVQGVQLLVPTPLVLRELVNFWLQACAHLLCSDCVRAANLKVILLSIMDVVMNAQICHGSAAPSVSEFGPADGAVVKVRLAYQTDGSDSGLREGGHHGWHR